MNIVKEYIHNFIPNISKEIIELIINNSELQELKKGSIIIEENAIPTHIYILKKGIVRSFITDSKTKEYIKNIFLPINLFGSFSLIEQTPSKLTYDCLTDCEIVQIDFANFITLTDTNHEVSKLYNKILESLFLNREKRIFELTILNGTERYLKLKQEIPGIDNLITQYHIASYLNITPVQLSRIRKKLYSV